MKGTGLVCGLEQPCVLHTMCNICWPHPCHTVHGVGLGCTLQVAPTPAQPCPFRFSTWFVGTDLDLPWIHCEGPVWFRCHLLCAAWTSPTCPDWPHVLCAACMLTPTPALCADHIRWAQCIMCRASDLGPACAVYGLWGQFETHMQ